MPTNRAENSPMRQPPGEPFFGGNPCAVGRALPSLGPVPSASAPELALYAFNPPLVRRSPRGRVGQVLVSVGSQIF